MARYQFFRPSKQNFIEYTARGDQSIGSKDHLLLRYFYDSFDNAGVLDTTNLLSYSDQACDSLPQCAHLGDAHLYGQDSE